MMCGGNTKLLFLVAFVHKIVNINQISRYYDIFQSSLPYPGGSEEIPTSFGTWVENLEPVINVESN